MTKQKHELSDLQIDSIEAQLWQSLISGEQPNVYAILDGARDKRIEPMLNNGTLEYACLYQGKLSYAMQRAAPHIVKLERNHPLTRKILRLGWGHSWGIFCVCSADVAIVSIRNNFRRIAKVKAPGGKVLVFRYYDPRVLRDFLPTCNTQQLSTIFGPVKKILYENEAATAMLTNRIDLSGGQLTTSIESLISENENYTVREN